MRFSTKQMYSIVLLLTFLITSSFILLYDYPLGSEPAFFRHTPPREDVWTGGTIPDEDAYYGWAQIYFETGKQYVYLEDLGPDKVASVDFFLGWNESTSVFTTFSIIHTEQNVPEWFPKTRDIQISIVDGKGDGLANALVRLTRFEPSGGTQQWDLTTDQKGTILFEGTLPGFYQYEVRTPLNQDRPLIQRFATDYPNFDYPITVTARIRSMPPGSAVVMLHIDHHANPNLRDIPIFAGPPDSGPPICFTDERGDCLIDLPIGGRLFHLTAIKKNEGTYPPLASGIVDVNGRYAIANHWPPGYCYLIIPFWLMGAIEFIGVFLSAIAVLSTFILARRFASLRVAVASSILTAVCGLGMIMLYSRGMADYASMTFGVAGIALFVESLQDWKVRYPRFGGPLSVLLGLLGGLSLAFSVTTRYSTVVVLLGPLVYFFLVLEKGERGWRRFLPTKSSLARGLVRVAPFLAGLLIVGALLASYNTSLFGGPFNSGYQMNVRAVFDPETGNLTVTQPEKSMLESYFHPSWEMFDNMWNTILPTLFFLIPIIYMTPVPLWQERRRKETWLMFFWLLPVYLIYMQLTWVGHIYEDMRYFLPVLPPTAILISLSLERNLLSDSRFQVYGLLVIILIAVSGFLVADYCINWQLARLAGGMRRMTFDPPAIVGFLATTALMIFYGAVLYRAYMERSRRESKGEIEDSDPQPDKRK